MRHRLPLLRPLSALVVLFVAVAITALCALRLERVVTAPGRLAGGAEAADGVPTRFEGWLDDRGRVAVSAGQPARVRVEALPWLRHGALTGRVDRVGASRTRGGGGEGFAVVIALEVRAAGDTTRLADGLAGQARIRVARPVTLGELLFEHLKDGERP